LSRMGPWIGPTTVEILPGTPRLASAGLLRLHAYYTYYYNAVVKPPLHFSTSNTSLAPAVTATKRFEGRSPAQTQSGPLEIARHQPLHES
jgi:hypothetical protein